MGENVVSSNYSVDIVFCIDATLSMQGLIDKVKNNALHFYDDLMRAMSLKDKRVTELRVKIVAYRDYVADKGDAMLVTDFFKLPQDALEFEKCIKSIKAKGGGDEPEDGLEALAYSIRSNWNKAEGKHRQVIVLWTDASAHPLGFGNKEPNYPRNMAKNFAELSEWWGSPQLPSEFIDEHSKRLVIFGPAQVKNRGELITTAWSAISDNWNQVAHYPSEAGSGLEEFDYNAIIDAVANTI